MGFILTSDAREYFKHIMPDSKSSPSYGKLSSKMDAYYFCAMAAMTVEGRPTHPKEDILQGETEFIDHWIADYTRAKDELLALLAAAELKRRAYDSDDEAQVRGLMLLLFDSSTATNLRSEGMKALNLYAARGIELIREAMPDPPHEVPDFLVGYRAQFADS